MFINTLLITIVWKVLQSLGSDLDAAPIHSRDHGDYVDIY
jgi:hypothetical protein